MNSEVVRAGEIAAMMNRARSMGYDVIRWPEEKGGGFLQWKDGLFTLVQCESERWREAWANTMNVEGV